MEAGTGAPFCQNAPVSCKLIISIVTLSWENDCKEAQKVKRCATLKYNTNLPISNGKRKETESSCRVNENASIDSCIWWRFSKRRPGSEIFLA